MANHLNDTWFFDVGLDDSDPPYVEDQAPAPGDLDVSLSSPVIFSVKDDASGVDLSTVDVIIDINGTPATVISGGVVQPGFSAVISAIAGGFQFEITPDTAFEISQTITVTIDAADLAAIPNVMPTVQYQFFTAFPIPVCALEECRIVSLLGSIIQLDARGSSVEGGGTLTFEWKFIEVPAGSAFEIDLNVTNPASLKDLRPNSLSAVSFIPDVLGNYVVELKAVAGPSESEPCYALVEIGLSRALCGGGGVPDASFVWSFISNFWGLVEDRGYFETLWSGQLQLISAELVKLYSNDYNKSLATIQSTVQRRWQKFDLKTRLSDQVQRVIVGNTKEGLTASTGAIGAPGVGTTELAHTLLANEDFTTIDINYGAKGRIIEVDGEFGTISKVSNVVDGGTDYSLVVLDDKALTDGKSGVPYRIPHMIHIPLLDLEDEGVRAGDLLVLEWIRGDGKLRAEMPVRILAVDRERIGFEFTQEELSVGDPTLDYDLFRQVVQDLNIVHPSSADDEIATAANALIAFVPPGVNLSVRPFSSYQITVRAGYIIHNSAKKIDENYSSIPYLQEELKEDPAVVLRENKDYTLSNGYLNFASGLFSVDSPAPDELWAECAHVDNTDAIENNFGRLAELGPDDLEDKATRAPYLAAVKGLWFALTNSPTVANVRLGLQVLMGLPFAEERGKILDVTNNFKTDGFGQPIGRILVEDVDPGGKRLGIRRFYFFPENVGISTNPKTGSPYAVGDIVEAFAVLSNGVEVTDYVKDPDWWNITLAGREIQKFFLFKAQIDTESGVFDENDLVFSLEFLKKIKPTYTDIIASALRGLTDDTLDQFQDSIEGSVVRQQFYDNVGHFGGHESTVRGDDYSHQGITLWRGDSRPFSTRSAHTLRDVVTVQNGADVEASSATGFGQARARITGDASTPTVEGDILVLHPGQPGSSPGAQALYEFLSLGAATGPGVLNSAPSGDPTTFDLDKPDSNLFPYGSDLSGSVVRRAVNPKVVGTDLSTTAGALQIADSATSTFVDDGVQLDDHLVIESGANLGEYRIQSVVTQTVPRDYTPSGVPQIANTQVALVNLDGTNPALADLAGQKFRIVSPAMMRTRVSNAQILESGGNMFAEALDPVTGFPFDVFTPGMVGETLVVQNAENPVNNQVYTIQAYVHPGRVQITVGSPETSDASAQAVLTIQSQYHPGIERAEELAPTEVFSAVVS